MRKIKKINGFLVVKFNDREKREYEGTALGEYGVIDAEVYTGNLDIDRGAMEYDDADTLEVAVELARGLESEEDITDEPSTYTAAVETNESYTEETVEPAALIEGWTRRLATRVKSKHYPDTDPRTAAHELYGFKMALHQIGFLPENECEHYAAQIAEAGAAWETVLEGVSFEDLSRLRHLLREVDEYIKDGGELFNGFQHETERIPAHRLEELHQLGTALLGECPENDCTIYRNVFRMAVDVDGQMGKLTGHARETMQREYDRLLRELNHLYTMNHAVKKYREAQHDRT